jgi:RNA polymerase sigma-70 factor (ECF subfamily)
MMPAPSRDGSDQRSIINLYEIYRQPLLTYLTRLVSDREIAEDLCQDTFVKALRSWSRHDPSANPVAWLYRIATNTAYDHLRRRRRIRFVPLPDIDLVTQQTSMSESHLEDQEPVRRALSKLPPEYRIPLVLHTCEGRSTQEIADAMGCSNGAIKTRLFRARERFRQAYQG